MSKKHKLKTLHSETLNRSIITNLQLVYCITAKIAVFSMISIGCAKYGLEMKTPNLWIT